MRIRVRILLFISVLIPIRIRIQGAGFGSWSDFKFTKNFIFTWKIYRYLKQVICQKHTYEGTKVFLMMHETRFICLFLVSFHAPGSGSAFPIRIRIQDGQLSSDPDPQHSFLFIYPLGSADVWRLHVLRSHGVPHPPQLLHHRVHFQGTQQNTLPLVLRIRIHRIHMFLGLLDPDPDPLVRGTDPDPSIIKQK
jgi:hypothetical protein